MTLSTFSPRVSAARSARTRKKRGRRAPPGILRVATPLRLEHGGELASWDLAYESHGRTDLPVVIALGGISAGRHIAAHHGNRAPGWWQPQVGPGRAIDTTRCCAIGIDYLGGAGASSGPGKLSPFPMVDSRDQARAIAALLDHLAVARAHAIVGASYGGMVALAFAELFPDRLDRAVVLSAAHCSHPMATAMRSLQRQVVRLGLECGRGNDALRIARGFAMTTYRSAEEFADRFAQAPLFEDERARFPVEDYLENCGARFAQVFPPESFLRLSESIDLHSIEPERIAVPTIVLGVNGDALVPCWQIRELAARIAGPVRLVEIDSIYGHDAFLKEEAVIANLLTEALQ